MRDYCLIEFEGQVFHKSGRGFYFCPWECSNPDFPQRKWKSDKGFLKHLEGCKGRIDAKPLRKPTVLAQEPLTVFCQCTDCGVDIMKYTSVWRMTHKNVCLDCCVNYEEGFLDCAGLELPDISLIA